MGKDLQGIELGALFHGSIRRGQETPRSNLKILKIKWNMMPSLVLENSDIRVELIVVF